MSLRLPRVRHRPIANRFRVARTSRICDVANHSGETLDTMSASAQDASLSKVHLWNRTPGCNVHVDMVLLLIVDKKSERAHLQSSIDGHSCRIGVVVTHPFG